MNIAIKYFLLMIFAGVFGGLINYFIVIEEPENNKINKFPTFMKSITIGIGASLLVPLFLSMISSNLIDIKSENYKNMLIFLGFCLIASISSKRFILSITNKVIKDIEVLKHEQIESKQRIQEIEERYVNDAKTLSFLDEFFELELDDDSKNKLRTLIQGSSEQVKSIAFDKAKSLRKRLSTELEEESAGKICLIFETIIEADSDNIDDKIHAEIAYTLINKKEPTEEDCEKALDELNKAIEIRDSEGRQKLFTYEFNRAICRILKDKQFKNNKQSDEEYAKNILSDINKAKRFKHWKNVIEKKLYKERGRNAKLFEWLDLNRIFEE